MTDGPAGAQRLRHLALLRRVRDRIDRDFAQPLDVAALARGVRMSAGHLSRQFELAYGESPYSHRTTRRIERAMTVLRGGDQPGRPGPGGPQRRRLQRHALGPGLSPDQPGTSVVLAPPAVDPAPRMTNVARSPR